MPLMNTTFENVLRFSMKIVKVVYPFKTYKQFIWDSATSSTRRCRLTCEELMSRHYRHFFDNDSKHSQQQRLSLPIVLEILSHYSRNRQEHLQYAFQLLDPQNQGFASVDGLQNLAAAAAAAEAKDSAAPLPTPQDDGDKEQDLAQRMIHFFGTRTAKTGDNDRIYPQDFQRIFQPPDP
jgi:hypothetical protein